MTRFARAKGSKASNGRAVEEATSWQDMKRSVGKKTEETSSYNVKELLKPEKTNKTPQWCEFPDSGQTKQSKIKRKGSVAEQSESSAKKTKKVNLDDGNKEDTIKSPLKRKKQKSDAQIDIKQPVHAKPSTKKLNKKKIHSFSDTHQQDEEQAIPSAKMKKQKFDIKKPNCNYQGRSDKYNKGKTEVNKFQKHHGEYKRRKPNSQVDVMFINGIEIEISYYDGFPIKKEDAERLVKLKKEMISRGLPRSEVATALKLERRKAEKALAREKKKVCFNCRLSGHNLSECPALKEGVNAQMCETGICFKCGSTEHTHFECKVVRGDNFKFAQCFICKEQGHISRQCPDNNKGLYPKGGACRVCGDVTHLKKDCPAYQAQQSENQVVADTINDHNIEALENVDVQDKVYKKKNKSHKVVKF